MQGPKKSPSPSLPGHGAALTPHPGDSPCPVTCPRAPSQERCHNELPSLARGGEPWGPARLLLRGPAAAGRAVNGVSVPSTRPGQNGARRRQQRFGGQEEAGLCPSRGSPRGALRSHPFPVPSSPPAAGSTPVPARGVARLWLGKLETLLGAALAARETSHVRNRHCLLPAPSGTGGGVRGGGCPGSERCPWPPWGGCELGEGWVGAGGAAPPRHAGSSSSSCRDLKKKKKSLSIRLSKCLSEAGEATINIG